MDPKPMGEQELRSLLRRPLARRTMISVVGAGTLATVMAACGGGAASPTAAPAKPVEAAKPTEAPKPAATQAPPTVQPTAAPAAAPTPTAAAAKPAEAAKPTEAAKPAAPAAAAGGTMVIGMWQEPENLIAFITNMTFSIWINKALNESMVKTVKDDKLQAILLQEIPTVDNGGVSKDGKTYTLKFKPGLKWSDGAPLTGEDLVFTWQTVMKPAFGANSTTGWDAIDQIELSSDKLTATIRLKAVRVPFLYEVVANAVDSSAGFLMPKHILGALPVDQIGKDPFGAPGGNKFVGNGPFKIVEWKKNQNLTVERNPNYSGSPAKLDKIIFNFLASREAQIDGLRTGDLDYAVNFVEAQLPDLEKLPESKVHANKAVGSIERYYFNLFEPNSDRAKPHRLWGGVKEGAEIRKAISMGINRQAIVDKILFGKTTVAVNDQDNSAWFNTNLKPYAFDPKKAEEVLEAAGWKKGADGIREKNGVKFEFTHSTTSANVTRETIQRAVIADLEKIGVRMKIENYKPAEMFANFAAGGVGATGKTDMFGWTTGTFDPDQTDLYHSGKIPNKEKPDGSNYTGYKSAEMDDILAKQAQAIDVKERKALIDKFQELLYNDCPTLYIYDRLNIDVAKSHMSGIEPYPVAGFWWNINEWSSSRKK